MSPLLKEYRAIEHTVSGEHLRSGYNLLSEFIW